jgi:hypothetical protein
MLAGMKPFLCADGNVFGSATDERIINTAQERAFAVFSKRAD